jgi:hypothetical protein
MELQDVLSVLESADRMGAVQDVPEGSRYIQISDTLARQMVEALRRAVGR